MTLREYNGLDELERAIMLWQQGVMAAYKQERETRIVLYQLHSFYVEVYHNIYENRIEKLLTFAGTNQLDEYIDHIDLTEITSR